MKSLKKSIQKSWCSEVLLRKHGTVMWLRTLDEQLVVIAVVQSMDKLLLIQTSETMWNESCLLQNQPGHVQLDCNGSLGRAAMVHDLCPTPQMCFFWLFCFGTMTSLCRVQLNSFTIWKNLIWTLWSLKFTISTTVHSAAIAVLVLDIAGYFCSGQMAKEQMMMWLQNSGQLCWWAKSIKKGVTLWSKNITRRKQICSQLVSPTEVILVVWHVIYSSILQAAIHSNAPQR